MDLKKLDELTTKLKDVCTEIEDKTRRAVAAEGEAERLRERVTELDNERSAIRAELINILPE